MDRNMQARIAFAVVAIPTALGIVWLGGWPLVALLTAAGVLGTRELFAIARAREVRPSVVLGLGAAAIASPLAWLTLTEPGIRALVMEWWPYAGALWVLGALTWATARRAPGDHPLAATAVTFVGPIYVAALPAFLLVLRHAAFGLRSWQGTALVFFPLVVTWVGDSAAMSGGRAFGGPRLAPTISPGKTRSGGLAGLAGSALAGALWAALVLTPMGIPLGAGTGAGMGLLLGVVGQVGDLAESLLKREAGVKDSSHLIPGHGGVLDRFDSLIFVLPVSATLFRLIGLL
jgi:phosphatidate cytidylyltransferase